MSSSESLMAGFGMMALAASLGQTCVTGVYRLWKGNGKMKLQLTTGERLRRVWRLFSAGAGDWHRHALPYVIKISGAVDGPVLWSRPGSLLPTRYVSRATAERRAVQVARLYPGLRVRVLRRVSGAPLSATLRRHARVMSW